MTQIQQIIFLSFVVFAPHYAGAGNLTALDGVLHFPGDTARLGCVPTDSDNDVTWYRNDQEIKEDKRIAIEKYAENSTIEIRYAGRDDIGIYVCKEDDQKQVEVMLRSVPYVYKTKSVNKNRGNTLELECRGYGIPAPSVTWFAADKPLVDDGKRITFKNTTAMKNGVLVIKELTAADYSEYMCMATNDFGTYNSTTLVRVKNPLRVLWPILLIIIQIAALAIIIFVHERRKKKA